MEQAASKEGELLPLHLVHSPCVLRTKPGSTADSGMRAELTTASGLSMGTDQRQQKILTRLQAGMARVSQERGVGPAGCERDGGLPQASP